MKLASLKLIAAKKPSIATDEQHRRNKLVRRLREQIALAKSQQSGVLFAPQKQRTIKDAETGVRQVVTTNKRVKAWWFATENNRQSDNRDIGPPSCGQNESRRHVDVLD
jgi:hypothetical protein